MVQMAGVGRGVQWETHLPFSLSLDPSALQLILEVIELTVENLHYY